jgi:hypothetical protein
VGDCEDISDDAIHAAGLGKRGLGALIGLVAATDPAKGVGNLALVRYRTSRP